MSEYLPLVSSQVSIKVAVSLMTGLKKVLFCIVSNLSYTGGFVTKYEVCKGFPRYFINFG